MAAARSPVRAAALVLLVCLLAGCSQGEMRSGKAWKARREAGRGAGTCSSSPSRREPPRAPSSQRPTGPRRPFPHTPPAARPLGSNPDAPAPAAAAAANPATTLPASALEGEAEEQPEDAPAGAQRVEMKIINGAVVQGGDFDFMAALFHP